MQSFLNKENKELIEKKELNNPRVLTSLQLQAECLSLKEKLKNLDLSSVNNEYNTYNPYKEKLAEFKKLFNKIYTHAMMLESEEKKSILEEINKIVKSKDTKKHLNFYLNLFFRTSYGDDVLNTLNSGGLQGRATTDLQETLAYTRQILRGDIHVEARFGSVKAINELFGKEKDSSVRPKLFLAFRACLQYQVLNILPANNKDYQQLEIYINKLANEKTLMRNPTDNAHLAKFYRSLLQDNVPNAIKKGELTLENAEIWICQQINKATKENKVYSNAVIGLAKAYFRDKEGKLENAEWVGMGYIKDMVGEKNKLSVSLSQ